MSSEANNLLQVRAIDAFYGDLQVLWNVSLNVKKGECIALIGSNGAGKSTLLATILGLRPPTPRSGSITFLGKRIDEFASWNVINMGISLVPEGRRVFQYMTVMGNLLMGAHVKRARKKREETLEKVFELFPRLKERKNQLAGTLSGGERQMLVVGRGLMAIPQILMLDEPSLGLAPKLVSGIFEAIREIHREGTAIMIADQYVRDVLEIADRGYVLETGRIGLEGSGEDLLENKEVKKKYLGL